MISYLIDTNVISELAKPKPNPAVRDWIVRTDPDRLSASVVTLGEMRLGIENLPSGKRRYGLERWLEHGLPDWFAASLLPVTGEIADRWARITVEVRRKGLNPATTDGLIAATALTHKLILVTRNVKDFAPFGVPVLNPWPIETSPSSQPHTPN